MPFHFQGLQFYLMKPKCNFWVMKMTDSITAVKIPVKKGIETTDRIEIFRLSFLIRIKFF